MRRWAVLVFVLGAGPSVAASEDPGLTEAIHQRVDWLMFRDVSDIGGVPILAAELLGELYAETEHSPLWLSRAQIDALWTVADLAVAEGLDRRDYPLDVLERLLPAAGLPADHAVRANADLLATEIFLRIGYQLRFGKVNPVRQFAEWNFDRPLREGRERTATILDVIRSGSLVDAVKRITARGPLFDALVGILAELREIEEAGGWGTVSVGPTLRQGDVDARVVELRRRLNEPAQEGGPSTFDPALKEAVMEFQRRHALDADGVAGPKTIAAMNVPASQRALQVRASLERARWVFEDFRAQSGPIVIVNIAAAQVALLNGTDIVWSSRAQVGRPYRQTPVFRGDMQYLEFNPTWTVPPTILKNDVLPRLREDGTPYLVEKNMDLLDRDGNVVPLDGIEWAALGLNGFPYIVRQRPGPWNALGMVKFIFPNPHFVFLHDTPSKELFDRSERAFSSGCIRVEAPFELAELLLDDPLQWNQRSIREVLDGGRRTVVHLDETIPVYLLYWTADLGQRGVAHFYPDIYGRDRVLFEAMEAGPVIDLAR